MIRSPATLIAFIFSAFLVATARAQPPAAADVVHSSLAQPTSLPNNPATDQPPLPPLDAVIAHAKNNPFIYGLYIWTGEYFQLQEQIRKVGWRSFRLGGPFDDGTMTKLVREDAEFFRTIGAKAKTDADPAGDEALLSEQRDNITKFVERYGPGGTFFKEHADLPNRPMRDMEVWNEPNFQYLIKPDKRPQMQQEPEREALYAKVLANAYTTVKAHNPAVQVIGFSTGGASAGDIRFIQHVLKSDPKLVHDMDVFATHPYIDPALPECYRHEVWGKYSIASALATIRQTLADAGRTDLPIWYTEVGWQLSGADGGKYPLPAAKSVTPELQAAYTCRLYAYALRLGVERVTNMFAVDTDGYNGGFFQPDGKWRPSAHAVQTMISVMPAPRLLEAISDGTDGYFAYRFSTKEKSNNDVVMLWNVAGAKTVELPVTKPAVTVVDMLGHEQVATPIHGKLSIEIGPMPVYVE